MIKKQSFDQSFSCPNSKMETKKTPEKHFWKFMDRLLFLSCPTLSLKITLFEFPLLQLQRMQNTPTTSPNKKCVRFSKLRV